MDHTSHQTNAGSQSAAGALPGPLDVAALTRGMVRGEEATYRRFYDAYFNRLFRYLLVAARGDEQSARDALQAALVRVVRHIKVFSDEATFWSWLTVLARSALSDDLRKSRRYLSFLDRFTLQADIEHAGNDDHFVEERLCALLERDVASLDEDEQRLVEWKYFARRSVRDIAGELQTTEKAVESRLTRIRRKLKDRMLAELNDEPET